MPDAPTPRSTKTTDRQNALLGFRIIGDFGATLAVPVVVLALAGKALDERFGTRPWLLIAGFVIAAVISGVSIVRKAQRYGKEYENIGKTGLKPPPTA